MGEPFPSEESKMLIVLTLILVIASLMMILLRKSNESLLLFGMCISLALEICGVMIFIAKKGGIAEDVMLFLYFSKAIHTRIQYLSITLNQLGYLIALGRVLFPLFFLEMAIQYSMIVWIRKRQWIKSLVKILPFVSLIIYYPPLFRKVTEQRVEVQNFIMHYHHVWLTTYLLIAVFLLLWEYKAITMKYCKRQFGQICFSMLSMGLLYILYYRQDPGQVYRFYSYDFVWNKGIGYLQFNPSLTSYVGLVVITVVCMAIGFYSLFQYTSEVYEEQREDIVMQRKFDMARVGASMFVHGMKNQLLASKVIYKRIWQNMQNPDMELLKEYILSLESMNNSMLDRVEELYRSIKQNAIILSPVGLDEILKDSVDRFYKKYPMNCLQVDYPKEMFILADRPQLCEAIYNILINAQEAVNNSHKENGKVIMSCNNERLYTVIKILDTGIGMHKKQMKKAFEPFYTSKNSNYNWGMGLYYAREVVKGHLGNIRIESKIGEGTSFYIMLPRYH